MNRNSIVGAAFVVVVACAACGSPTGTDRVRTTVAKVVPTKAATIAKKLGCVNPATIGPGAPIKGLPTAIERVACVAGPTRYSIAVYATPDDVEVLLSPPGRAAYCALLRRFAVRGNVYTVVGSTFQVSAGSSTPGGPNATLAQAQAVGDTLGFPVTTFNCG